MKIRSKHFAYGLAVTVLAAAGINVASALALPGGGWTIWYYSDAAHTTMVGNLTLSCATGELHTTGQTTAFQGPRIQVKCGTPPLPPGPYGQW